MEINNLYWKTKDGRKINVDDMDDQHIRNAFKMILRKLKSKEEEIKAKTFKVELNGDMAQQFNDQHEYDDMEDLFIYNEF
tara:strand:- start:3104 stop:3343 length:240 start_codon:yes stop_codon:yes gene_type:complete